MACLPAHDEAPGVPRKTAFDEAKVARIAEAIANGSFKVDAEAIADRLLADAHRLVTDAHARRSEPGAT